MSLAAFLGFAGLLATISHAVGDSNLMSSPDSTWQVYSNKTYHYQISYPPGFVLYPTGIDSARDGRTIRVVRKHHSSILDILDIQVYPAVPMPNVLGPIDPKHLAVDSTTADINGVSGTQLLLREKKTNLLMKAVVYRKGVSFTYVPGSQVEDFQKTMWWRIITTFSDN